MYRDRVSQHQTTAAFPTDEQKVKLLHAAGKSCPTGINRLISLLNLSPRSASVKPGTGVKLWSIITLFPKKDIYDAILQLLYANYKVKEIIMAYANNFCTFFLLFINWIKM